MDQNQLNFVKDKYFQKIPQSNFLENFKLLFSGGLPVQSDEMELY